ncbi:MAG: ankyrin repeat domain-containing protein [Campylobacterota bacterium]|nr:ankyrin repeat domain-containing protein [Campylobacterota bacterium]
MLNKLFKRKFTNENYLQELLLDKLKERWLKEGIETKIIDIDYQDTLGNTFLMICLKKNKLKAANWLLDNGANVVLKNKDDKSIINIAIEKESKVFFKKLLALKKVDIDQKDEYGRSLLQNLIVFGSFELAKILIDSGANINTLDNKGRHIMYDALSYGDPSFVGYLLTFDNIKLNDIDEDGNTLMQHPQVIENDNLAIDLLIAGSDPTIKDKKGESFLFNTIMRGVKGERIVTIALNNGADVNQLTSSKNTIMMDSVLEASKLGTTHKFKRESILRSVKNMLEHKGNINALDASGESGLFNAIKIKDLELISFLLEAGIDTNIQNRKGETVLELLVYEGLNYSDTIKLLLIYDINPSLVNKKNQTIYEVLNNIILHILGTKLITDEKIVSLIDPDGLYINVVQLLLEEESIRNEYEDDYILDFLDSTGDPIFFKPLMYDHFALFSIYTKYNINIHKINKEKHNIFFSYVLRVFENDKSTASVCNHFKDNVSSLISRKIDKDFKDSLGFTILHKIVGTKCNIRLFDILIKVVRFNYETVDNLGRTVIHSCVWHNKSEVIKSIVKVAPKILNIEDKYGISPLFYAALLGNKSLVLQFLDSGANISSSTQIDPKAIKKFKPMLKNLDKLKVDVDDLSMLNKFDSIIEQVEYRFKV